jgi:hypothetical protein
VYQGKQQILFSAPIHTYMYAYIKIKFGNHLKNDRNRYKIQIEVSDISDSTTFTIFDKEAEKLIGKTTKELAHMQFEIRNHNLFVLLL